MSDQADNRCVSMRYIGLSDDGKKQYDMVIEVGPTVEVSFTKINAMLNRSHTAPRELVEAAKTFRDLVGEKAFNPKDSVWAGHCPYCNSHWMSGHSDTCRFDKADQALRSALSSQEPKVCDKCNNGTVIESYVDLDDTGTEQKITGPAPCPHCVGKVCECRTKAEAHAIAHSINAHDALVDMVKKLRDHLNMLSDLLGDQGYFRRSEDATEIVREADELLKGGQ